MVDCNIKIYLKYDRSELRAIFVLKSYLDSQVTSWPTRNVRFHPVIFLYLPLAYRFLHRICIFQHQ